MPPSRRSPVGSSHNAGARSLPRPASHRERHSTRRWRRDRGQVKMRWLTRAFFPGRIARVGAARSRGIARTARVGRHPHSRAARQSTSRAGPARGRDQSLSLRMAWPRERPLLVHAGPCRALPLARIGSAARPHRPSHRRARGRAGSLALNKQPSRARTTTHRYRPGHLRAHLPDVHYGPSRVERARERQLARQEPVNARLQPADVARHCVPKPRPRNCSRRRCRVSRFPPALTTACWRWRARLRSRRMRSYDTATSRKPSAIAGSMRRSCASKIRRTLERRMLRWVT